MVRVAAGYVFLLVELRSANEVAEHEASRHRDDEVAAYRQPVVQVPAPLWYKLSRIAELAQGRSRRTCRRCRAPPRLARAW